MWLSSCHRAVAGRGACDGPRDSTPASDDHRASDTVSVLADSRALSSDSHKQHRTEISGNRGTTDCLARAVPGTQPTTQSPRAKRSEPQIAQIRPTGLYSSSSSSPRYHRVDPRPLPYSVLTRGFNHEVHEGHEDRKDKRRRKEETRFLPCSSPTFVLFVPFVVNSFHQVPVKPTP